MEDNLNLQNCGNDDVLSFTARMLKVNSLKQKLYSLFSKCKLGDELSQSLSINLGSKRIKENGRFRDFPISSQQWFEDGIDCEILKVGAKSWQKGKVKINLKVSLEFCPDEPEVKETPEINKLELQQPESLLDDIRRVVFENNQ